jgi:hypothetical protein
MVDRLAVPSIRDSKCGNRKQNKRYAEDIIKWIEDGEKLLAGRPEAFHPASLFRERPILPDQPLIVTRFAGECFWFLKDILAHMRQQAKSIIDIGFGAHGNSGQDQKLAAEVAAGLMAEHGLPATYSSENSVYCTVARLCFEAITGRSSENGEDIRRACRVIAQEHAADESTQLGLPPSAMLSANYLILASLAKELRKSGDIGTEKAPKSSFLYRTETHKKSAFLCWRKSGKSCQ